MQKTVPLSLSRSFWCSTALSALLLVMSPAWSQEQDEQVLADVGVLVINEPGRSGIVRPDFADRDTDSQYFEWLDPNSPVPPVDGAESVNLRSMVISPRGTALVLDGNTVREFNASGVEPPLGDRRNNGFPFDCTEPVFLGPKGKDVQLSECTAFTALNDGTLRIAGQIKSGFVIIAAKNLGVDGWDVKLAADGTPPAISDLARAEFAFEEDPDFEPAYYFVGERKTVGRVPIDRDIFSEQAVSEQNFEIITTLNGKTIDAVAPWVLGQVLVVLDTGEVLQIATRDGMDGAWEKGDILASTATDVHFPEVCDPPDRKEPQKYSLRADPINALAYLGNLHCGSVTLLTSSADGSLEQILVSDPLEDDATLTENPFLLEDGLSVTSLDWQEGVTVNVAGEGCTSPNGPTPFFNPALPDEDYCNLGQIDQQVSLWNVTAEGDTDKRFFLFKNLVDCRLAAEEDWVGPTCPTVGSCTGDPGTPGYECLLDVAQLAIQADRSGVFTEVAFGGDPKSAPEMLIASNIFGEECYPLDDPDDGAEDLECGEGSGKLFNNYRFNVLFAAKDSPFSGESIFRRTFLLDFQINDTRVNSDDVCIDAYTDESIYDLIADAPNPLPLIQETGNLIVYNSSDLRFGTVDRGGDEKDRGGVIINSFCNRGGGGFRFSAYSFGLEYISTDPRHYADEADRMLSELQQAKDELICEPDDESLTLLSDSDCQAIENDLRQVRFKFDTCIDSLTKPIQGDSEENCSALDTQIRALRSSVENADWPELLVAPEDALPADLRKLTPNREGEFFSRLDTFVYFLESYVKPSALPDGFPEE